MRTGHHTHASIGPRHQHLDTTDVHSPWHREPDQRQPDHFCAGHACTGRRFRCLRRPGARGQLHTGVTTPTTRRAECSAFPRRTRSQWCLIRHASYLGARGRTVFDVHLHLPRRAHSDGHFRVTYDAGLS